MPWRKFQKIIQSNKIRAISKSVSKPIRNASQISFDANPLKISLTQSEWIRVQNYWNWKFGLHYSEQFRAISKSVSEPIRIKFYISYNANPLKISLTQSEYIRVQNYWVRKFGLHYSEQFRAILKSVSELIRLTFEISFNALWIWISQIFTDWISDLQFHWFISVKIVFTVKSVNFHWFTSEKILFTVKSVNYHWNN